MAKYLYEYDRNVKFGPASQEMDDRYQAALQNGKPFILYPYHGYELRMVVREEKPSEEEQAFLESR